MSDSTNPVPGIPEMLGKAPTLGAGQGLIQPVPQPLIPSWPANDDDEEDQEYLGPDDFDDDGPDPAEYLLPSQHQVPAIAAADDGWPDPVSVAAGTSEAGDDMLPDAAVYTAVAVPILSHGRARRGVLSNPVPDLVLPWQMLGVLLAQSVLIAASALAMIDKWWAWGPIATFLYSAFTVSASAAATWMSARRGGSYLGSAAALVGVAGCLWLFPYLVLPLGAVTAVLAPVLGKVLRDA